jgi:hypothetical protein
MPAITWHDGALYIGESQKGKTWRVMYTGATK